ncbi:hypothetical protein FA95DRAFT_1609634 [Auriscalpium vulgare]|uniref:Uncharacterized protein n=1 Tax=Auriscalpium vulgare TaxID=40419 RepID=A0ACB8RG32_9AGAM|nr:hypothetical protein FA95DRAFT_1609634 [Auriscalpium vulgare]
MYSIQQDHGSHSVGDCSPKRTVKAPSILPTSKAHTDNQPTDWCQWQLDVFGAAVLPTVFIVITAGLAVALHSHLAAPLPPPPPGLEGLRVTVHGRTVAEEVFAWVDSVWPRGMQGVAAFALMLLGVVCVLRAGVWAVAEILGTQKIGGEERRARAVPVGKWEDGQSVSGNDMLTGMFL